MFSKFASVKCGLSAKIFFNIENARSTAIVVPGHRFKFMESAGFKFSNSMFKISTVSSSFSLFNIYFNIKTLSSLSVSDLIFSKMLLMDSDSFSIQFKIVIKQL
ncbi:hypothetical protein CDIK_3776 [Cucumispora dikerogammari]|nr:hypothetical protein CDIK_3776 [Cucumispora dikerogammari]